MPKNVSVSMCVCVCVFVRCGNGRNGRTPFRRPSLAMCANYAMAYYVALLFAIYYMAQAEHFGLVRLGGGQRDRERETISGMSIGERLPTEFGAIISRGREGGHR